MTIALDEEINTLTREYEELKQAILELDSDFEFEEKESTENVEKVTRKEEQQIEEEAKQCTYSNCVIVDNLPTVTEVKYDRLAKVITKIFQQMDKVVSVHMPFTPSGETAGIAYIEYQTEKGARKAVETVNNFALDKKHTLLVNLYTDVLKNATAPEEDAPFHEPKEPECQLANLNEWLLDIRDMYMIRYGTETEIYWWSNISKNMLCYDGEREKSQRKSWCNQYVTWSPKGSYLTTFHPQGIALWGNNEFMKQQRLAHAYANLAIYSPDEKYVYTWNPTNYKENAVIVWETATGKILRSFPFSACYFQTLDPREEFNLLTCDNEMKTMEEDPSALNHLMSSMGKLSMVSTSLHLYTPLQYSPSGKYVAKLGGKDIINIYELPSMALLEKRSLKTENVVVRFEWSPTDDILAYWSPGENNIPAKVTLIEIPSRRKISQKNLFNVVSCKLYWHPNGDYLAVHVLRHSKTKKRIFSNVELFCLREDFVPVEMLDLTERVNDLAWEPKGDRFAVSYGENNSRSTVAFYSMTKGQSADAKKEKSEELSLFYNLTKKIPKKKKSEVMLIETLESRPCNCLAWSPMGSVIVIAGINDCTDETKADLNGVLEFYDVNQRRTLSVQEHFKCNSVQWDPSGRYVVSVVGQLIQNAEVKYQIDNGYVIWNYQGRMLLDQRKDNFYQFVWRNRGESLLSREKQQDITKNYKLYEKKYKQEDTRIIQEEENQLKTLKKQKMVTFMKYLESQRKEWANRNEEYNKLLGRDEENEEYQIIKHTVEEVISRKEEEFGPEDEIVVE